MSRAIIYKDDIQIATIECGENILNVLAHIHTLQSESVFDACTDGPYAIRWPKGVTPYPNPETTSNVNLPPCRTCRGTGEVFYDHLAYTVPQVCPHCMGTTRYIHP